MFLNSKFGPFCIVTAGLIENKEVLEKLLFSKGISFSEVSRSGVNTTELIAKLISLGDTIVDGIEKMFDAIEGSCSLLLLNKDGIYAARDRFGYTPLVIGQKENEWVILLKGHAKLLFEKSDMIELFPGDNINIPTNTKHRVEWTDPVNETIWLAVFYQ